MRDQELRMSKSRGERSDPRRSASTDYTTWTDTRALSRRRLHRDRCGSGQTPSTNSSTGPSSKCKVRMSRGRKRRAVFSDHVLTKSLTRIEKNWRVGVSSPGEYEK